MKMQISGHLAFLCVFDYLTLSRPRTRTHTHTRAPTHTHTHTHTYTHPYTHTRAQQVIQSLEEENSVLKTTLEDYQARLDRTDARLRMLEDRRPRSPQRPSSRAPFAYDGRQRPRSRDASPLQPAPVRRRAAGGRSPSRSPGTRSPVARSPLRPRTTRRSAGGSTLRAWEAGDQSPVHRRSRYNDRATLSGSPSPVSRHRRRSPSSTYRALQRQAPAAAGGVANDVEEEETWRPRSPRTFKQLRGGPPRDQALLERIANKAKRLDEKLRSSPDYQVVGVKSTLFLRLM